MENKDEENQDRPIQLCSFYYLVQADSFKAALEAEGIEAFLVGDNIAGVASHYALADGGVRIFVRSSQFEKARAIKDQLIPRSKTPAELREAARRGEVECPECGSNNIVYTRGISTTLTLILLIFLIGILVLPLIPKRYACQSCGRKWNP